MAYAEDELVFHSYNAGFVVLSYFVSVIGCWTALELLHKRTSIRGLYNWYLLLGAATSMGAVAIWSMHFIGNRAITMGNGELDMQIAYSPAYTAGSFFLPICVVALAFYLFTVTERVSILATVVGGNLSGFAICGMHYLGQGGIANYQALYDWRFVFGSAIIAVVAATLALGVFFYFKAVWTNAWWKRMLSGCLLAVAVSGMHWVATAGTSYQAKRKDEVVMGGLDRGSTVVVVLCLALGSCLTLVAIALFGQRSRQRYANRAQQVVLACAAFDPDGRLMVTPEGLLPCRKITNSYIQRSFDDVFSTDHPVFCWIYRASRFWKGVADLVPGMRTHLRATSFAKGSHLGSTNPSKESVDMTEDYSQAFKELFCVAAADLASMIQEPLENLGALYDDIISTGTVRKKGRAKLFSKTTEADLERASQITFGRGQLLFVVRKTSKLEAAQLQAAGFRFAALHNVIDILAQSMQVTTQDLLPHLESMRNYQVLPKMLEPGVHLACFALRPVFQRGFDVMVDSGAKNLLPTVPLSMPRLDRWHTDFISRLDDWEVTRCLEWLGKQAADESVSEDEKIFSGQLYRALNQLVAYIDDPFFLSAHLTARPLRSPCQSSDGSSTLGQAEIIAFRCITDVHQSWLRSSRVQFSPSRFFRDQQHVYPNSPDHAIFAGRAHKEFAPLHERKERVTANSRSSTGISRARNILSRSASSPTVPTCAFHSPSSDFGAGIAGDNSSEKHLVEAQSYSPFGGIHVANEVSIDVTEIRRDEQTPEMEMTNLGVRSEVAVAPTERESFVDELMALTIGERRAFQRS